MSNWTHTVCLGCYKILSPDREPHVSIDAKKEDCCICGAETAAGIYLRIDPSKTMCKGIHAEDEVKKVQPLNDPPVAGVCVNCPPYMDCMKWNGCSCVCHKRKSEG